MLIDTTFDFRSDASGRDPDRYSPTLQLYHKRLWSKPLPTGRLFDLDDTVRGAYLHPSSELGEFFLCSDSVIPTFTRWVSLRRIIERFTKEENEAFRTISYTIGGMMVFPGNRIDGKQTINGARGLYKTGRCNPSVTLLARELSVSHDTVQRAINTLEAEGFLTRVSALANATSMTSPA